MRMDPKLNNRHGLSRRNHRAGKCFPLGQDRLDVVFDELAQAHAQTRSAVIAMVASCLVLKPVYSSMAALSTRVG